MRRRGSLRQSDRAEGGTRGRRDLLEVVRPVQAGKTQESLDGIAPCARTIQRVSTERREGARGRCAEMAGQPVDPSKMDDDDLKLLAIQGLQGMDPNARSLRVRRSSARTTASRQEAALFLLATFSEPRAHQALLSYAEGKGNRSCSAKPSASGLARPSADDGGQFKRIYESTDVAGRDHRRLPRVGQQDGALQRRGQSRHHDGTPPAKWPQ